MKKIFVMFFLISLMFIHICYAGNFVDNGDGTISDSYNKLMWQKSEGSYSNWSGANSYCNNLTLGNYEDWRLPTLDELKTIVDRSNIPPSIDNTVFSCKKTLYWTSTAYDSDKTWCIHFYYGFKYWRNNSENNYVRCVRDIVEENGLDCSKYTDKASCESNSNCTSATDFFGKFKSCILNCVQYTSQSSCESAFDGNSCSWNSAFGTCGVK